MAGEERRLEEVRAQVDRELGLERMRLSTGQETLRKFIKDVTEVCQEQLAALEVVVAAELQIVQIDDPGGLQVLPDGLAAAVGEGVGILAYMYTMIRKSRELGVPLTRQSLNRCGRSC